MDPIQLRNYRERWRAVGEIEREEQRSSSLNDRWQQLNNLYLLGQAIAVLRDETQEKIVWERWARLKSRI